MCFIYKLVETFNFPNETVNKNLWQKFDRKGVYLSCLKDTDSTCLKFIISNDPKRNNCEKKNRNIMFEVIIASKIYDRFDSLNEYSRKTWLEKRKP